MRIVWHRAFARLFVHPAKAGCYNRASTGKPKINSLSRQAALPRNVEVFSFEARRTLAARTGVQAVTATPAVKMAGAKPDPYRNGKKDDRKNGDYDLVPASEELLQWLFIAPGTLRS